MSEEKTEVKPEVVAKPITIKSIILGIIGAIAGVTAASILGPTSGFIPTAEVAVMMTVILALLQLFTPIKFTLAEYVFIYAMTYGGSAGYDWATRWPAGLFFHATTPAWLQKYMSYVPGFYYLPKEAYDLALQGGVAPPWGMLIPAFITMTVLGVFLNTLTTLAVLPFKKQIVEVERLPYPATSAAFSAVNTVILPKEEQAAPVLGSRRNWLLLGLLIGFITVIFTEGYLVSTLWPGAPVIPEWIGDREGAPGMFFDYLPGFIIGIHMSSLFPWGWFGYFAPLEALLSIMIFTFIGMFILVWEVTSGKIPYEPGDAYEDIGYMDYRYGINLYMMGNVMLAAAVLAHFIVGYKYILETIKSKEKEEPGFISPQMMWILSLLSVIILTAFGVVLGAPPHVGFFIVLFMVYLNTMWSIRGLGEVNLAVRGYGLTRAFSAGISELFGVATPGTGEVTPPVVGMFLLPYHIIDGNMGSFALVETSRFAFLSRVKATKAIIIGIIVGAAISILVGCFIQGSLIYGLGLAHEVYGQPTAYYGLAIHRVRYYVEYAYVDRITEDRIPWAIGFFILAMVLVFLRAKFAVIMPLTAISAGLAFYLVDFDVTGWAYTFLPFLIIKYLVLKIGGPKLDEQVARPFFAGAAAGGLFGAVVSGIAITMKALGMI